MSATIDEPGVMDSGANISITNPDVVTKFNLQPQRWDQPFHIKFGNGSRFFCTHFAYFGPIFGRVAIVDAAPDTLVSIVVLTASRTKNYSIMDPSIPRLAYGTSIFSPSSTHQTTLLPFLITRMLTSHTRTPAITSATRPFLTSP